MDFPLFFPFFFHLKASIFVPICPQDNKRIRNKQKKTKINRSCINSWMTAVQSKPASVSKNGQLGREASLKITLSITSVCSSVRHGIHPYVINPISGKHYQSLNAKQGFELRSKHLKFPPHGHGLKKAAFLVWENFLRFPRLFRLFFLFFFLLLFAGQHCLSKRQMDIWTCMQACTRDVAKLKVRSSIQNQQVHHVTFRWAKQKKKTKKKWMKTTDWHKLILLCHFLLCQSCVVTDAPRKAFDGS